MVNSIVFPGRYIQGPGALEKLGLEISRFGENAFLIAGRTPLVKILPDIKRKLDRSVRLTVEGFGGESSDEEIARLSDLGRDIKPNVIIGMGGGKTLDTAKSVADKLKTPLIIIPTIASSDAPCSAVSVIYSPKGVFKRVDVHPHNPDVVLVDTDLLVQAPVRYLVAGMGDALATYYEAESCREKRAANTSGYPGAMTAYDLAYICNQRLFKDGVSAKIDCESHRVTPAFESIVETNILLSGIGFESGGVAAAHAIHDGLLSLPETHAFLHGERVAFGTLASLFLTKKPKNLIDNVYSFCEAVGLPTTLSQIGLGKVSGEDILKVATSTCGVDIIFNEPLPVSPELIAAAIKEADLFGKKRSAGKT